MKDVVIYTDGASRGNGSENSLGAFGIVMMYKDSKGNTHTKEVKEFKMGATNNYMELGAVVHALKLLKCPCNVQLFTDSKYVCDAINRNWLSNWVAKGWVTSGRKPVANRELWEELLPLLTKHRVTFTWVKGHASNKYNNRCDELANIVIDEFLLGGK